jgi:hypothetical protein
VARLCVAAGAAEVRIVRLCEHAPGLPPGGDLADILADERWCGLALGDNATPEGLGQWIIAAAEAAEPWQPEAAKEAEALTYEPFPVEVLPESVRDFVVEASQAIGCDCSYIALPLLVAAASAIGNTRRLVLKHGWHVPPILWGAIVGESGTCKTPAFRVVMKPIMEAQAEQLRRYEEACLRYEAEVLQYEKNLAEWKRNRRDVQPPPDKPEPPQAVRYVVSDTTVEALAPILKSNPRGVLLARDELSGWIGSFERYANTGKGKASADAAHWLSMYSAESITVDRKTGTPKTIYVPHAAVSVVGGIQPGILRRALSIEHLESGLAARLLMAFPPRRAKRWTESDITPEHEAMLAQIFGRLLMLNGNTDDEGNNQPISVKLTCEAKALWIRYYNSHNIEQTDLTDEMAAAWSKLEEAAARLGMVVHYLGWAGGSIHDELLLGEEAMAAGIALAEWFKREARRVYAMFGESVEERDQRRLVAWIETKGGVVTAREVQRGCRWLREPGQAEAALEKLVKAGLGHWEQSTAGQRGQPTRRFKLSTLSTVDGNTTFHEKNRNTVDVDTVDAHDSATEPTKPPNGQPDAGDSDAGDSCGKSQDVNDLLAEAAAEDDWGVV